MVKRIVKGDEENFKNTEVLKDQNILSFQHDEIFLKFQEQDIKKIIDRMEYDISLLQSFNLMDYSLLFVVAYNPEYVKLNKNDFKIGSKKKNFILKNPESNPESVKNKSKKMQRKQAEQFLQKMTGYT